MSEVSLKMTAMPKTCCTAALQLCTVAVSHCFVCLKCLLIKAQGVQWSRCWGSYFLSAKIWFDVCVDTPCGLCVSTQSVHTVWTLRVDTLCGAGKEPSERNVYSSYQGSVTSVSCLNLLSPPRVLSKVGSLFQLLWGETMTGTVTCRGQHLITAFVHTVCSACTLL